MKELRVLILTVTALLFTAPFSGAASSNVCFDCHEQELFKNTVIHQPVLESKCSTCHNPHVARYRGLLRKQEATLCYSCHEQSKKQFNQGIVHPPVAQGKCSVCHAPHASTEKGLINKNLAENCFTCHKNLKKEYTQTHKPYADGDCISCHKPHQADNLQLLNEEADSLCLSCHNDSRQLDSAHKDYPAALKGCLSCHNPHGSERKGLIRDFLHKPYAENCGSCHQGSAKVSMSTCLKCHEKISEEILTTHSHISLQDGNSCLNCHSPHAGNNKALLKDREEQVCRSCHAQTLDLYKDTISRHPPVEKCSSCHESHGSKNLGMLKGDGNAVCVQCHETQGNFTHPVGPEVLEDHTGQMVTCVSCHNPMGTKYKYHLVQEGKRDLCILCHRAY